MGSTRENRQESGDARDKGDDAPPPYEEASHLQGTTATMDSKRTHDGSRDAAEARPTVESPFNFPPAYSPSTSYPNGNASGLAGSSASSAPEVQYSDLPEVVNSSPAFSDLPEAVFPSQSRITSISTPVFLAIPQIAARPTSPFPPAYNAAILLRRGISREAFTSFLSTLTRSRTSTGVGRSVQESAKKGNLIGAGVAAIGGTVAVPLVAALRVVDVTLNQLPAAVLSKKPLTPRERADTYLAIAQKDWFENRGLRALLCNTAELLLLHAQFCGASSGSDSESEAAVNHLMDLVHRTAKGGPEGQLRALQGEFGFASLEIVDGWPSKTRHLDIGAGTLWLVLTDVPSEASRASGKGSY
ncbi:hypothetical protein GQX73_g1895 [Xylaria multiplex]|uniref:Uncharacterized protein n=1 Tax=Xylaria multiplex TaxID=323545 RepID=A0A7C8IWF1_9PEZI|nr:hypothetical protein GQX73_g1895 [Xylaria multiplex]